MKIKRVLSFSRTACVNHKICLSPVSLAIKSSIVGVGLAHGLVQAATIEVDTNLDTGFGCSLREAIISANTITDQNNGCQLGSNSGTDTITFSNSLASPLNSIVLTNGEFFLENKNIEINASTISGGVTIDANDASIIFNVSSVTLTLDSMTMTGGTGIGAGGIFSYGSNINLINSRVSGNSSRGITADYSTLILNNSIVDGNSSFNGGGGIRATVVSNVTLNNSTVTGNSSSSGGGIFATNSSKVYLNNSTVSGNSATNGGGGIYADSSVDLNNSTISGNSASAGGGLYTRNSSNVSLLNSTVSGNYATFDGGGIFALDSASVSLVNSTITDNAALFSGGAIFARASANVSLRNSIVGNSLSSSDCFNSSSVIADASTIIEDGSCNANRSGDPGLLPLANNGGPTKTHALKQNSIARNTGLPANCPSQDQRGQRRDISDGFCDVGAYEFIDDMFYVIPLGNGKTVVVPL